MSLSDKEKVLQYILSQKIPPDGKLFLSAKRYCEIDNISPNEFIKQLFALQDDSLISVYFHGQSDASTATDLSVFPKALTYFNDKNKVKKDKILKPVIATTREIIMLAIGAIFGGIVTFVLSFIIG